MSITLSNPNEMRRRASSKALILAALQQAGARGCTNLELNDIAFRYGGRIFELRREGYDIPEPTVEAPGVYRYTLLTAPAAPKPGEAGFLASLPVVASITGRAIRSASTDSTPAATGLLFDL
jgi:hypothetical protein